MVQHNNSTKPDSVHDGVPRPATVAQFLQNDNKVKVAGIDCDGMLRGKIMSKGKFLASVEKGFGMSSAIFGWDMHDQLHSVTADSTQPGYADFTAIPDLRSFRRIPWEDNVPFFLLHFVVEGTPMYADGRSMLRSLSSKLQELGWESLAGGKSGEMKSL
jgi:glutamine synthetase